MTFGTFDRFHPGHEYYLREAHKKWEKLLTVVARDETVHRVKWKLAYDNENTRLRNVIESGLSDEVVLWSLSDPYQVILDHTPDILCFGYDQNSFNNEQLVQFFEKNHLNPTIVRLNAFNPEKWKSSLL